MDKLDNNDKENLKSILDYLDISDVLQKTNVELLLQKIMETKTITISKWETKKRKPKEK